MNKCIFLDRDGVINKDYVNYSYKLETFEILDKVPEALQLLKDAGYLLIIITNQSGIAKGIYTKKEVMDCYNYIQSNCRNLIDDQYFAHHHPDYDTESLSRKPDSLMLERAIAKYQIDINQSWMIGDSIRDMQAAQKVNLKTIFTPTQSAKYSPDKDYTGHADHLADNLYNAVEVILNLSENN